MTRERLPQRRRTEVIKVRRDNIAFHVRVGFFADGRPGEVFAGSGKEGSDLQMMLNDACILISLALQHGATIDDLLHSIQVDKHGIYMSVVGAILQAIQNAMVEPVPEAAE